MNVGAVSLVVYQIITYAKRTLSIRCMLLTQIIASLYMTICMIWVILGFCGVLHGGYKTFYDFIFTIVAA